MDIVKEQSSDPYAAPTVQVDPGSVSTKRYPWIAIVLAVLSPSFSMLYVARGWRALGYLAVSIGVIILGFGLNAVIGVPLNAAQTLGSIAIAIVGAVDGYRRAKAWPETARLPWYARWYGLASIAIIPFLMLVGLRAFVVEPFRIPSGAMIPTLLVGDYILVSKSAYGLRLPLSKQRIVALGNPQRGDVIVFRFPENPSLDYVKRVVGIPGDRVAYRNKQLTINSKAVPMTLVAHHQSAESRLNYVATEEYREDLDGHPHAVLINPEVPAIQLAGVRQFPYREACEYSEEGFVCTVPEGHYFTMGDNRDSSSDSRYWGFVPEDYLVGRAFMIWSSTARPERIGLKVN